MPFTFSHPAIVLPLYKSKIFRAVFPFLVIGSMAPDFEYFLRLRLYSIYSHTLWGILYFCVPVALLVYAVYEHLVRPQLAKHYLQEMYVPRAFSASLFFYGVIGIIIGAGSHIFWDAFTHENGQFAAPYPWYSILQHTSTLLGGIAVVLFLWHFWKTKHFRLWHSFTFHSIVVAVILFFVMVGFQKALYLGYIIPDAIASVAYALVLTSLAYRWMRK